MANDTDTAKTSVVAGKTPQPDFEEESQGFLPIETNWFDRLFISVVLWVALSLFWLRFLEPIGLSIWICVVISILLAAIIIRKG